ncbi:hypothetical protein GCM10009612_74100 [Streptomyces beijiangensis]
MLGGAQLPYGDVESTRGENPVGDTHPGVGGTRILRKVPNGTGAGDVPGGRIDLPRKDVEEGGLPGTVTADEADAVAGSDVEVDVGQEEAGADADVDTTKGDHWITLRISSRTHGWREGV